MTLSPRQLEIVELVGRDGAQWKTVGERLGISRSTVLSHVRRAMARFGLTHRTPREACTAIYYKHVGSTDDGREGDAPIDD